MRSSGICLYVLGSFHLMSSRLYVRINDRFSSFLQVNPISLFIHVCLYISFFVYPSVDGQADSILSIMNSAAINMGGRCPFEY